MPTKRPIVRIVLSMLLAKNMLLVRVPIVAMSTFSGLRKRELPLAMSKIYMIIDKTYETPMVTANVFPVLWVLNSRLPSMKRPVLNKRLKMIA